ncbi:hypothetical protein KGM_211756 [Danaus plexippus plexippus]|uniref:U1-type domain-containing protein n=1 Tax=Danaus plexippus plexippus TaxID=278856 RepID=A0A212F2P6_DANPL|nr:hypothetical protein KGM_211756 [Danaus plexippus plexippus]
MVKGDRVLINSAILLNQNQWNTITDDNKCHVCGVAVQDINGHISSARHKYNLDNYKPLKVFDLHITRKIGDYNHCAVCNSLYDARDHGKHVDSEIHLERMLYATNRAVDVTNDIDGTDVTSDSVSYDTNPVCDTESGFNSENTDLCDTDPGSDNVRSTGFSFVCALCDVVVCDINHHVRDLTHVLSLQNAIFQPSLGINLIRMVREYAHCAICNVVLNIVDIHAHVVNQYHVTLLHNAIIHPFPPHNFANTVHVPVNNVPVMPHPFGINNRMPNMPAFHHTTNNINGNLYKTVNTENFNTSIKKNVSRHEESNALKIVDTANEETKSTASKELIGARNRNDIIDTSHMSTENTLDMSTDETRTDVVNVTNSNTKIMDDKEYESRLSNDTLYIRNRNDVIGMSQMTYNSLVRTGDGKRYCFVCSIKITLSIEEHVGSERHVDRMKECKFIAEYGKNLLRQATAFRDGDSDFDIEDSIKILLNVKSGVKKSKNIGGYVIFLYGDKKLMNVTFDAYHGLNIKNRSHCNICGEYFTDRDLHLEEESHIQALETPLEVEYLPSCYRKVKDGTLNCVTCNTNFPNTKKNIKQHTSGKGHEENYSRLMEDAFTIV